MKFLTVSSLVGLMAIASAQVSPKLEAEILANPNGVVEVVCYVAGQRTYEVALPIKEAYQPHLLALGDEVKRIALQAQARPLSPLERARHRFLLQRIDALQDQRKRDLTLALQTSAAPGLEVVKSAMTGLGGTPRGSSAILPLVWGRMPSRAVEDLSHHPLVGFVDVPGASEPALNNHKVSLGLTGPSGFWQNGYTGGTFDIGILDSGVFRAHPAFAGFNWEGAESDPGGHGTGVAGIAISKNATYTGMSSGLHTVCASTVVFGDWNLLYEQAEWMVTQTIETPDVINFSGASTTNMTVDYSIQSQFVDSVVDTFDIIWANSAGNSGWGPASIRDPASSYNAIVVANVMDEDTVTRSDDVITTSSSRGPTLSGRRKPDIAAPGTDSFSTTNSGGFGNIGGTSAASPHVAGGAILLRDFGIVTTYGVKAVLINSAESWSDNETLHIESDDGPVMGRRWDRTYGHGYLQLGRAYVQAPLLIESSMPRPLGGPRSHYYVGNSPTAAKSTLVWNKHTSQFIGEPPASHYTLSNLELTIFNRTNGSLLDSSTSSVDNVEQVYSSASGARVLRVYTQGSFHPNIISEGYALACAAAYTPVTPPSLSVSFDLPSHALPGAEIEVTATISNSGQLEARNVIASIDTTVAIPSHSQQVAVIPAGGSVDVHWLVQLDQSPGTQAVTVSASSDCWGAVFSGDRTENIALLPPMLAPSEYQTVRGILESGNLASVAQSDNDRLVYKPGIVLSPAQSPVELIFRATAPIANPSMLVAHVESNASSGSILQRVDAWNYSTNAWVQVHLSNLSTTDRTVLIQIPHAGGSLYVHPTTNQVQLRFSTRAVAPVLALPWRARIDRLGWHVVN